MRHTSKVAFVNLNRKNAQIVRYAKIIKWSIPITPGGAEAEIILVSDEISIKVKSNEKELIEGLSVGKSCGSAMNGTMRDAIVITMSDIRINSNCRSILSNIQYPSTKTA
jgi:hypothetical protein